MNDNKNVIHIRIRDLRREKSLTQEELAEALGVSRQSINAMEAGRCLPSLPVALQIASFFSVPITLLFGLEEEMQQAVQQIQQIQPVGNQRKENMSQLVPWSPLREMREMLDEMMDETMNYAPATGVTVPAVNISQTEQEVHIDLRLPGFKKEDLTIEVGEDFLAVSGEAKHDHAEGNKQYFRREFVSQNFSRTVSLPAIVQTTGAEAEMKHGVLNIRLKKAVEEKPKTNRIEIKAD